MEQFASLKRSKDGQPVRYLVVDDSVFARKNLARIVETFGGQVAGEAGDGMTAITEYDRTNPDIVLMDITMPQMEGIEAAEKIVGQHPEACIVMVSPLAPGNIAAALARCPSLRAETGQARSSVGGDQVRAGRGWSCRRRRRGRA